VRQTVVRDFARVERAQIDAILAWFAADAVYLNMPIAPVRFQPRPEVLEIFVPPRRDQVGSGRRGPRNVVFTERVDRFTVGDKEIALPVAGVFEIRDGKIAAWRDYFDMASYQRQLG
jgi:limonene-1,2-epoxide hydrolase